VGIHGHVQSSAKHVLVNLRVDTWADHDSVCRLLLSVRSLIG
jgi:hypothetical protein